MHWLKHCEYNNEDEDNSPNILRDENYQASSQKFTQISIGLMSRVFANGPGDWSSIPVQVIPKTQKIVHDVTLLNTQHYKVQIKG